MVKKWGQKFIDHLEKWAYEKDSYMLNKTCIMGSNLWANFQNKLSNS